MQLARLKKLIVAALEDRKALDIKVVDVRGKTSFTDLMVIASGTSNRHVKSLADNVLVAAKAAGLKPLGVEGEREGEWVLVDLADAVVHVMQPATRDFYNLEKLWAVSRDGEAAAVPVPVPKKAAAEKKAAAGTSAKQVALPKKKPAPRAKKA